MERYPFFFFFFFSFFFFFLLSSYFFLFLPLLSFVLSFWSSLCLLIKWRYTQEDVAEVVEYARQRGVRVMVCWGEKERGKRSGKDAFPFSFFFPFSFQLIFKTNSSSSTCRATLAAGVLATPKFARKFLSSSPPLLLPSFPPPLLSPLLSSPLLLLLFSFSFYYVLISPTALPPAPNLWTPRQTQRLISLLACLVKVKENNKKEEEKRRERKRSEKVEGGIEERNKERRRGGRWDVIDMITSDWK